MAATADRAVVEIADHGAAEIAGLAAADLEAVTADHAAVQIADHAAAALIGVVSPDRTPPGLLRRMSMLPKRRRVFLRSPLRRFKKKRPV